MTGLQHGAREPACRPGRVGAILVLLCVGGCFFNSDAPCSANERLSEENLCVCAEGYVLDDRLRCVEVTCEEGEVIDEGECVCEWGRYRPTPQATCTWWPPTGYAEACDPNSADCGSPLDCVTDIDANNVCALSCSDDVGCPGYSVCRLTGAQGYCEPAPLGLGKPCEKEQDCAGPGYVATYCDTYETHQCLIQGCTFDPDSCFTNWKCCDFSNFALGNLCIEGTTCPFGP